MSVIGVSSVMIFLTSFSMALLNGACKVLCVLHRQGLLQELTVIWSSHHYNYACERVSAKIISLCGL